MDNEKNVAQTEDDLDEDMKELLSDDDSDEKSSDILATDVNESKQEAPKVEPKQDPTPNAAETKQEEEDKKPKQTKEQNSEFARQRREAERLEAIAKAKDEARIQAIIEGVGTNPYTEKPIENKEDVEEYLLMKRIEREGKDPIQDYPSYIKKQKSEIEINKSSEEKDLEAKRKDLVDFKTAYPDVDLDELSSDEDFDLFCKGKLGKEPLKDIYKDYLDYNERVLKKNEKKLEEKAIELQARANSSVGSRDVPQAEENDVYTLEQLKSMSTEDMIKNWAKVEKSRKLLKV